MERPSTLPLAAAFGNAAHAPISINTVRRGRRGANNEMRARNYETRALMGGPGRRNRNRGRSRNRRPLNLPGLTSNINMRHGNNASGHNYLNAAPSRPSRDPLMNYNNDRRTRAAFNRARGPSMSRNNTRRRPFNRDPSLGRTNTSLDETKIMQYIARTLTKILNKYESRYGENTPTYIFAYNHNMSNSIGSGSQLKHGEPGADVFIHIPPNWQSVMEKYYKTLHVHSATSTLANLKSLRKHAYTADEVKTAISTSHFNV